ncbi:unnamed protein product [Pleuronectes platessa]|uniref:Uncharacterized protein n=1 Tax=Pleuronectes platessa TaxID=8262 RepID=A0A9N7YNR5_PLEPL|nr:unnamed protein product [Pleuronectes platessa]
MEQICTGHKSYKAQLSPPLLLLRFTAQASQERLSAEGAPKHCYDSESIVPPLRTRNEISPPTSQPDASRRTPSASSSANTRRLELRRVLWLVIYPGLLRQISGGLCHVDRLTRPEVPCALDALAETGCRSAAASSLGTSKPGASSPPTAPIDSAGTNFNSALPVLSDISAMYTTTTCTTTVSQASSVAQAFV